ncbi:MAG TPA: hypothetical protein VGM41_19260 [Chitinophagaceae bacterium]|jgi:hypothetical protein
MAYPIQYNETDFITQLTEQLRRDNDWKVGKESYGGIADLVIEDIHSGKRIFIEFRTAGQYGELPISSALVLDEQKKRLSEKDALFLVTFSGVSKTLGNKLKDLGIKVFASPTVEDVVGNVQYAMSA